MDIAHKIERIFCLFLDAFVGDFRWILSIKKKVRGVCVGGGEAIEKDRKTGVE